MYKNSIILALSAFFCFFQWQTEKIIQILPILGIGYGDLQPSVLELPVQWGGIGYGVRSNLQINPKNPVSYTAVDSLTFMFDLDVSGRVTEFNSGSNQQYNQRVVLIYCFSTSCFEMAGNECRSWYSFSSVCYDYSFSDTVAFNGDELPTTQSFSGTGGISQLYGGFLQMFFR